MKSFVFAIALLTTLSLAARADVSADDQAFIAQHTSDVIKITPKKIDDPAVAKAFSATFFDLTIAIDQGGDGGTSSQDVMVARVDDKLVAVSRPGTDEDCPAILKIINSSFKLSTDDDAKTLQAAFDAVYPVPTDSDKKLVAFKHSGNSWTFIRGAFMNDKNLGFIITTDDTGTITGVKFSLSI